MSFFSRASENFLVSSFSFFHKKSKNYKALTKADAIKWANAAWDSISSDHVINGCKKCYMDPNDLDEEMAVYDDKYEEKF